MLIGNVCSQGGQQVFFSQCVVLCTEQVSIFCFNCNYALILINNGSLFVDFLWPCIFYQMIFLFHRIVGINTRDSVTSMKMHRWHLQTIHFGCQIRGNLSGIHWHFPNTSQTHPHRAFCHELARCAKWFLVGCHWQFNAAECDFKLFSLFFVVKWREEMMVIGDCCLYLFPWPL